MQLKKCNARIINKILIQKAKTLKNNKKLHCNLSLKLYRLVKMAKGKTVTIRVPEDTFDEIKGICSDLGDAYNFNQFVNQSLGAILEVIRYEGNDVPIPKFAAMARLMKNYEKDLFVAKVGREGDS